MSKILSIDIGKVNPGIIYLNYNKEENIIERINVYKFLTFLNNNECAFILNYFISQKKIDLIIIEKQCSVNNMKLMSFIEGFATAHSITTIIKNPISYLINIEQKEKAVNTRKVKKSFSVKLLNAILLKQNIPVVFQQKEADSCDAINIALKYLYSLKNKKRDKNSTFEDSFNVPIKEFNFVTNLDKQTDFNRQTNEAINKCTNKQEI